MRMKKQQAAKVGMTINQGPTGEQSATVLSAILAAMARYRKGAR